MSTDVTWGYATVLAESEDIPPALPAVRIKLDLKVDPRDLAAFRQDVLDRASEIPQGSADYHSDTYPALMSALARLLVNR